MNSIFYICISFSKLFNLSSKSSIISDKNMSESEVTSEQRMQNEEDCKMDVDCSTMDSSKSSRMSTDETSENNENKHMKPPCTPALEKVRQTRMEFKVHSPSDALMSPCTRTLAEGNANRPKSVISHPQNLLRNKQHKEWLRKRPED